MLEATWILIICCQQPGRSLFYLLSLPQHTTECYQCQDPSPLESRAPCWRTPWSLKKRLSSLIRRTLSSSQSTCIWIGIKHIQTHREDEGLWWCQQYLGVMIEIALLQLQHARKMTRKALGSSISQTGVLCIRQKGWSTAIPHFSSTTRCLCRERWCRWALV